MTGQSGSGTISLTNGTYGQNFDTLANSGSSSVLPTGWYIQETGTAAAADGKYSAGTGTGTAGDVYSFGATGSSDRALGTLLSGTNTPMIGASFSNDTGGTISSLQIAYTGEEWRSGTAGRTDKIGFQISFDATSLTTGSWSPVTQLDFTSPDTADHRRQGRQFRGGAQRAFRTAFQPEHPRRGDLLDPLDRRRREQQRRRPGDRRFHDQRDLQPAAGRPSRRLLDRRCERHRRQ